MIGVIADDVTGASDVAVAFQRGGLSAALYFGVPSPEAHVPSVDVIVIALTTRMASPTEAVSRSLLALDWLLAHGTSQTYFKYCSTFDSTADGNIGPVLDALRERLAVTTVVTTPSSPEHGRTQYLGHLFVGDQLLSDSPMRDHPVTPMRDSNLGRLLATQSTGTIGLIDAPAVWAGKAEVQRRIAEAENDHTATVFVDATSHDDLRTIGGAVVDAVLLAGAAGLAEGFAEAVAKKKKRPAQPIGSVR